MREVSPGGAIPYAVAVHKQNETVVGAHADGVTSGDCCQFEGTAEVQDYGFAQGRRGVSNPGSLPFAVGRIRLNGILSLEWGRREGEGDYEGN